MLFHALNQSAGMYPNKEAIIIGNKRITYTDLLQDVNFLSARLRSFGIDALEHVAMVIPNTPEFIISYYALSSLHAISLPLDPQGKAAELVFYLHDNQVRFILTAAEQYATCRQAVRELGHEVQILRVDELLAAKTEPSRKSNDTPLYAGPVLYQYSSGSTGRAKKICRTQKNLACEAQMSIHALQITAQDIILCPSPLFHAYGLAVGMLVSVAAGATLVLIEQIKHDSASPHTHIPLVLQTLRLLELVEQEQVTILPGSPFLFSALAETPEERHYDLSSLRLCLTAGTLLPEETFQRFKKRFGILLRSAYGSTECGLIAINLEADVDVRHDCTGFPLPGVEVRIVTDTMLDLSPGVIGAIAVKSGSMTSGYLEMSELNAQAFREGFFLVGDLGKLDQQGRLSVIGRQRVFIDSGGEKIDPEEIEAVFSAHAAVSEVAVVGVPAAYGAEAIKAVIVAKAPVTEESLLALCRKKLANYKIPSFVVFRDALPRNSLGKVLKKDLLAELEERNGQEEALSVEVQAFQQALRGCGEDRKASQHLLEQWVCQKTAELLKGDASQVDARRPFAEMGLDSLRVVALRDRLAESLNIPLPVVSLWNYPTPAVLSSHLVLQLSPQTPDMVVQDTAWATVEASLELDIDQLQQLSDAEVRALLVQEILKQSEEEEHG